MLESPLLMLESFDGSLHGKLAEMSLVGGYALPPAVDEHENRRYSGADDGGHNSDSPDQLANSNSINIHWLT
jgi:hypothetical protein